MKDRRKEIQNRISKRNNRVKGKKELNYSWSQQYDDNPDGFEQVTSYDAVPSGGTSFFKKEYFFFKILAALVLFLAVGIMFKHPSEKLENGRDFVTKVMGTELQFAAISSWYENAFGKPIAFLPASPEAVVEEDTSNQYALPASGKIAESFESNGEGIILETGKGSKVEAMGEGLVIFAGVKEGLGKTVIIGHADKSESWYGQLESVNVGLYEFVKKGKELGTVMTSEDGSKGMFYLAIKKDEAFIDPKQVIPFE